MTARHALVVGGARGIGAALADRLLAAGWRVTIAGRASRAPDLEARGAAWIAADVSDPAQARRLVADAEPIDALVIAAGPYRRLPFREETDAGWREMMANNLDCVFSLAHAALPGMQARGWGRILTFSMANADKLQANPMVAGYYVAKVGVLVLTRTLAKIGGPSGVTANCVSPGFIKTSEEFPGILPGIEEQIPARRLGSPEDVVGAALFLLSDAAGYVNGANIHVSGGWGV